METIHKYPLEITKKPRVQMKLDAKIIHVGPDPSGLVCIWAEVEDQNPDIPRSFEIYGTGHELFLLETLKYVSTFIIGQFVWHLYEVK